MIEMNGGFDKPVSVLVIGAGDRGFAYSEYAMLHPDRLRIAAVAEPVEERKRRFADEYEIPGKHCFKSWEDALDKKIADAVFITTPDNLHYKPAMRAIELGYDCLIEKPIAPDPDECISIYHHSRRANVIAAVCHVLRYSPFWMKLKDFIDDGSIGEIISVEHLEGIGWWHFAHSYVRGNWRDTKTTAPMILAKSCHDMDLILWLTGKHCLSISSFGSLKHFKEENAPINSGDRCTACDAEPDCPYSALKLYLNMEISGWPVSVITSDMSFEGRLEAIKEGPYGKCVYRCDNNAADHQIASIELESGVTASLSVSAFTQLGRRIRVMGTMGELIGDGFTITHRNFRNYTERSIPVLPDGEDSTTGHGGGDYGIVDAFVNAVHYQDPGCLSSGLDVSVESHLMAFAAEESRIRKEVVRLK